MKRKAGKNGGWADDENGMPIFVDDKGEDVVIDVVRLMTGVKNSSERAETQKRENETLTAELAKFKGLDPERAKEAIETVGSLSAGDLKKKADVDALLKTTREAWVKSDLEPVQTELVALRGEVRRERVEKPFFTSETIKKTRYHDMPEDAVRRFSGNIDLDKAGKPIVYRRRDESGKLIDPVYSKTDPSTYAEFDEGLTALIEASTDAQTIWRDRTKGGGGSLGSPSQPATINNDAAVGEGRLFGAFS